MNLTKRGCHEQFRSWPRSVSREIVETTDEGVRTALELIGKPFCLTLQKVSGTWFGGPKVHPSKVAAAYFFSFVQLPGIAASGRKSSSRDISKRNRR